MLSNKELHKSLQEKTLHRPYKEATKERVPGLPRHKLELRTGSGGIVPTALPAGPGPGRPHCVENARNFMGALSYSPPPLYSILPHRFPFNYAHLGLTMRPSKGETYKQG